MKIRKLRVQDAPLMLEWMHDYSVIQYFRENFADKKLDDCVRFIISSQDETENIHFAVADDADEYMGTVSLKHIRQGTAEFGIALRDCGIGCGYAASALQEILEYGYKNRGIDTVYLCVDPENRRALRFYEKHGFQRCEVPDQASGYTDEEKRKYIWYQLKKHP